MEKEPDISDTSVYSGTSLFKFSEIRTLLYMGSLDTLICPKVSGIESFCCNTASMSTLLTLAFLARCNSITRLNIDLILTVCHLLGSHRDHYGAILLYFT